MADKKDGVAVHSRLVEQSNTPIAFPAMTRLAEVFAAWDADRENINPSVVLSNADKEPGEVAVGPECYVETYTRGSGILYVEMTDRVRAYVGASMLVRGCARFEFSIAQMFGTEYALVRILHRDIISSRWLAVVHLDSVPDMRGGEHG